MKKTTVAVSVCCVLTIAAISGCAPLLVGGAAVTTVSTMMDRRSTGAVVNDGVLEKRVLWEINTALPTVESHITVTAYNGRVLLSGEIATEQARQTAENTARTSLDVGEVINELAVMPNAGVLQRLGESSLATKVRSRMIATNNVFLHQMKVVVDRDIVYLLGIVTPEENKLACDVAAKTSGVKRVISLVEILSAERIAQRLRDIENARKTKEKSQDMPD